MPKMVYIAIGAKRHRESGNVFCAATLSYDGNDRDYKARFTDILTRATSGGETTESGGLAYMLRKALNRLTEPCFVRVRIGTNPQELTLSMTAYSGASGKPVSPAMKSLNPAIYPELIKTINSRVASGNIQVGRIDDDPLVVEVNEMAESFRQDWLEKRGLLQKPAPSSAPSSNQPAP